MDGGEVAGATGGVDEVVVVVGGGGSLSGEGESECAAEKGWESEGFVRV